MIDVCIKYVVTSTKLVWHDEATHMMHMTHRMIWHDPYLDVVWAVADRRSCKEKSLVFRKHISRMEIFDESDAEIID